MNVLRSLTGLVGLGLLLGLTTVARADDPPTKPGAGSFDPVPIQTGHQVLDPTDSSITRLAFEPVTETLRPAPAPEPVLTPSAIRPARTEGGRVVPITSEASGPPSQAQLHSQSPSTFIMAENFEGVFNPPTDPTNWERLSTTTYFWDDVDCFPVDVGGVRAAWPGDLADLNPCAPDFDNYANNMSSWLIYGPFSLADANAATLDFYYRMVSESCSPLTDCDYLFWGASLNGNDFYGKFASGNYTNGIFQNGYNFTSLDLSDVPTLGDLTGQSQVWIGFRFVSNASITSSGPFLDLISLRKNTDRRVYLTNETFEGVAEFPRPLWESFDLDSTINGEYYWDDVSIVGQGGTSCPPRSGEWSLWPADNGADGRNACAGEPYANNMNSWVVYGPFSLAGASEAWVDFYFRNQSEFNQDYLFWGVSTDRSVFYGFEISGTFTGGPEGNGYNLRRFDLSTVPTLGDVRGQTEVWLAFIFTSNGSITGQGAFVDDVSVVVERTVNSLVYLPVSIKSPPVVAPKANLLINNQTGGPIANYTIINPTLNGNAIPNIVCANIPAGNSSFNCNASFDPGTYQVSSTNSCSPPTTSGQVTFTIGDNLRLVRCLN